MGKVAFLRLASLILMLDRASCENPPRARPDAYQTEVEVSVGSDASLRCPVLERVDYVKWYHGDLIGAWQEPRLKVSDRGALKIQRVEPGDAGHYRCEAINGYGMAEASINLVVRDYKTLNAEDILDNSYPLLETGPSRRNPANGRPKFKAEQPPDGELMLRKEGDGVKMKCQAEGNPKPQITWTKDGFALSGPDYGVRIRTNHFALNIQPLQVQDSGLYTCLVYNQYGTINSNFTLRVLGRNDVSKLELEGSKPELLGLDPLNTTVDEGQKITLFCRVKSQVKPHVQWFKLIEPNWVPELEPQRLINLDQKYYQVLTPLESVEQTDGTFLNRFQVTKSQVKHTGIYICMAANNHGFTFKEAFVNVLSKSEISLEKQVKQLPQSMIIIIATAGAAVFLVLVFMIYKCFRHDAKLPAKPGPAPTQEDSGSLKLMAEPDSKVRQPLPRTHWVCERCPAVPHKQRHYHQHYARHYHHHDIPNSTN